jgi:hypothetical protein
MERKLGLVLVFTAMCLILLPCLRIAMICSGWAEPVGLMKFTDMAITTPMGRLALPMNSSMDKGANISMEMMAGFFFIVAGAALGRMGVGILAGVRRREDEYLPEAARKTAAPTLPSAK